MSREARRAATGGAAGVRPPALGSSRLVTLPWVLGTELHRSVLPWWVSVLDVILFILPFLPFEWGCLLRATVYGQQLTFFLLFQGSQLEFASNLRGDFGLGLFSSAGTVARWQLLETEQMRFAQRPTGLLRARVGRLQSRPRSPRLCELRWGFGGGVVASVLICGFTHW